MENMLNYVIIVGKNIKQKHKNEKKNEKIKFGIRNFRQDNPDILSMRWNLSKTKSSFFVIEVLCLLVIYPYECYICNTGV